MGERRARLRKDGAEEPADDADPTARQCLAETLLSARKRGYAANREKKE